MPGSATAPERLGNEVLRRQLAAVQDRVRTIMREFNIVSGHICAMARDAERAISDTALRADFLRLLIDLHEFGRQARDRGLLPLTVAHAGPAPDSGEGAPRAADGRRLNAVADNASDAVADDASRAFFARLDQADQDRGPMLSNRGQR